MATVVSVGGTVGDGVGVTVQGTVGVNVGVHPTHGVRVGVDVARACVGVDVGVLVGAGWQEPPLTSAVPSW